MSSAPPRLLVVEDDDALRGCLVRAFRRLGFEVNAARDVASALRAALAAPPAYATLDFHLPDGDGLTLLGELRRVEPRLRAVLMSGTLSTEHEHTARALGVVGVLRKPVSADELAEALLVRA